MRLPGDNIFQRMEDGLLWPARVVTRHGKNGGYSVRPRIYRSPRLGYSFPETSVASCLIGSSTTAELPASMKKRVLPLRTWMAC